MTIDYRLTMKCSDCYAVTTYTNERPAWIDGQPAPSFARVVSPERYVTCPACGGEALPVDAGDLDVEQEQATA